jgi:hypothetical protein
MEIRTVIDLTTDPVAWGKFTNDQIERAAKLAGRDALRAMKTEASRYIRGRKGMKISVVQDALFADQLERPGYLVWRVTASAKALPISAFRYRQTKRGVVAEINRGVSTLIRGAFEAEMRSGHVGIYRRRGKSRLPIDELFTSRVSDVMRDVAPNVLERGEAVFRKTFERVVTLRELVG